MLLAKVEGGGSAREALHAYTGAVAEGLQGDVRGLGDELQRTRGIRPGSGLSSDGQGH